MPNCNDDNIERINQIVLSFGYAHQKDHLFRRHEKMSEPYFRCLQSMAQNSLLLTSVVNASPKRLTNLESFRNGLLQAGSALMGNQSLENLIELDENDCQILSELLAHRINLEEDTQRALNRMYITSIVTCFEVFIQDLLYEVFERYPDTLRSNKTITYEELLRHPNMDSLVSYIAQLESSKSTEGSAKEYLARVAKRLGINGIEDLIKTGIIQDGIEDLVGIRNVIVHSGGVVDAAYIRRYPQSNFQEGECVEVTIKDIANISETVRLVVGVIESLVTEKFELIAKIEWSEEAEMYLQEILSLENYAV